MRDKHDDWHEWASIAAALLDIKYRKRDDEAAFRRFMAKVLTPL
jgi:hypothetical protein